MLDQPKEQTTIGAIWQRCRDWANAESELESCGEEGVERMAHDAGISAPELRQLARHGSRPADLLLDRMAALHLDQDEVLRREPAVLRDLQRVCTLCDTRRQCTCDLARDPSDSVWKRYCPNVQTLMALSAELRATERGR